MLRIPKESPGLTYKWEMTQGYAINPMLKEPGRTWISVCSIMKYYHLSHVLWSLAFPSLNEKFGLGDIDGSLKSQGFIFSSLGPFNILSRTPLFVLYESSCEYYMSKGRNNNCYLLSCVMNHTIKWYFICS